MEPSKGDILNLFVPDSKPHETIHLIAYSLLVLGVIVVTVGFFGCRAALRGTQCFIASVSKRTLLSPPTFRYRSRVKVGDVFIVVVPQYMSTMAVLIIVELVSAAISGLVTYQILADLKGRLTSKLAVDYGHDPTSDLAFSNSLDFAQYKAGLCRRFQDDFYEDYLRIVYLKFTRFSFLVNNVDNLDYCILQYRDEIYKRTNETVTAHTYI